MRKKAFGFIIAVSISSTFLLVLSEAMSAKQLSGE